MELKTVRTGVKALLVAVAIVMPVGQALAGNCDEASQAWAKQNLSRLPSTVQEFSAVPSEHSRAVFRMLSADSQSKLWRAQLSNYLKAHPNLSAEQKKALQDAIALVAPGLFRATADAQSQLKTELHGKLEALRARFVSLFGESETHNLLARLGTSGDSTPVTGLAAPGGGGTQCSCSDYSSYCSSGYNCAYGGCDSTSGCGTFWSYKCDGLCKSNTTTLEQAP